MAVRGVLFDFDGTLTRPGSLDFPRIKKAIDCPPDLPILEYLQTLEEARRCQAMEVLEDLENQAARRSEPNLDALELLIWLKERKTPFGLVTRNGIQSIRIALSHFKPLQAEDFHAIVTREQARPKPSPEGPLLAAYMLRLHPGSLMFVGDYRFDIMAGAAASMITVLLTNGNPDCLLPHDPRPHYRVTRLAELRSLLEG
jgi:hydrogenase expression/formation protein HypE